MSIRLCAQNQQYGAFFHKGVCAHHTLFVYIAAFAGPVHKNPSPPPNTLIDGLALIAAFEWKPFFCWTVFKMIFDSASVGSVSFSKSDPIIKKSPSLSDFPLKNQHLSLTVRRSQPIFSYRNEGSD